MVIIRKNELKQMSVDELKTKLSETEIALMEETANIKSGKRKKVIKYKPLRKLRARIITFLKQKGVVV
ncbi:MAG: 50S ribosomal protein L29 [Candidatus Micrarchaeota archaeon]